VSQGFWCRRCSRPFTLADSLVMQRQNLRRYKETRPPSEIHYAFGLRCQDRQVPMIFMLSVQRNSSRET
jgi:hypothetical protein